MKNLYKFFVATIMAFATCVAFSKTIAQECSDRSMVAMENASKLGLDFDEQKKWGANAASHCFREFESKTGSSPSSSQSGGGGGESSGAGWLWLIGGLGLLYWMWYRPDVNGFRVPFIDSPEERAEKIAEANKTDEEREFERKFYRTYELRKQLDIMVPGLTVSEIAIKTESNKIDTVFWLAGESKTCRDFQGISKVTIEDLVTLTESPAISISGRLSRRGLTCKESTKNRKK